MNVLFIALISLLGFTTTPTEVTVKSINTDASVIAWTGYKILGSHTGTLKVKEGNLEYKDGLLVGGSFVIDMTSIAVTDLEGEMAGKLVGHLSSSDFFGVQDHPTASFNITKIVSRGKAGDYKIKGDLTIKGITKSISFNTVVNEKGAKAETQIDRSEFDIQYGSGTFFDNLGDNTIYDEFDLGINLVLN